MSSPPGATDSADCSYGSFREVLPPILFLTLLFFLNFAARIFFAPLLPVIEAELQISHAASGAFFFFISSGYFVSILLSGFVARRLNHKRTIALSVVGAGSVLLIVGLCTTLLQLRLVLFCLGLTAGLYLPSALATITRLVTPAYQTRGLAVHELAPNLAFVMAPLLCELMLSLLSWRQGIGLFGVLLILVGCCYYLFSRGCAEYGSAPDLEIVTFYLRMPQFWVVTLLFSLAICSTLGIFTMLPLFLVADHGMETEQANGLVAVSRVASIGMVMVGGWLGDRFGNRVVVALALMTGGAMTVFLGLCPDRLLLFPVILQPMIAVLFFPSGFAIISRMGPREMGNIGVSLVIPLAFLVGGGVIPTLIGVVGDHFSIGIGIAGAGIMMFFGGVTPFFVSFSRRFSGKIS